MSENKPEVTPAEPVALDDRDPSNTQVEDLVAPLEPDDNVFTLVNPVQETREMAPVHDPVFSGNDDDQP